MNNIPQIPANVPAHFVVSCPNPVVGYSETLTYTVQRGQDVEALIAQVINDQARMAHWDNRTVPSREDFTVTVELPYSDEAMQAKVAMGGGWGRAAGYLLQLTDQNEREAVDSEAHTAANMLGGRYADHVYSIVQSFKRGNKSLPCTKANYDMLAREKAVREATGNFYVEPWSRTIAGLR